MNGSANPSGTATHTCPPVPSTGLSGGLIPHAVRPDRWCWAPDLGFHHRSAPHRRVQLRPAAGLLTRGHTIGVRRAVALGAGGAPADVAHAFSELEAWAGALALLTERVHVVYGYVNNHFAGHSPASARELQQRLGQRPVEPEQLGEQMSLF